METENRIKAMMKEPSRYSAVTEAAKELNVNLSTATKADILDLETMACMKYVNNDGVKPETF